MVDDLEPSSATSVTLIHRVKEHDPDAWRRLVQIYNPRVYSQARRAGIQEADAMDLCQEVFKELSRAVDGFEHKSFRGWLWTIAHRKILRILQHQNRQQAGFPPVQTASA